MKNHWGSGNFPLVMSRSNLTPLGLGIGFCVFLFLRPPEGRVLEGMLSKIHWWVGKYHHRR
jgi:hypothetical protein